MMPYPTYSPSLRADDGFSLLEMLLVLTILSLISAIAAPQFFGNKNRPDIERTLRSVAATVQQSRQKAVETGSKVSVFVDTKKKLLASADGSQVLTIDDKLTITVQTAENLINGDQTRIIFKPDGSSTGGQILLSDANGKTGQLTINWLTGITTIKIGEAIQ